MPVSHRSSQILRFLSAGSVGVTLYYLILYTLTDWAGVWYIASAVIGRTVSFSLTFILHRFWTFGEKSRANALNQAALYTCMGVGIFVANMAMLYTLVEHGGLWYMAAQVITSVTLTTIAYFISRKIFAN
ncbi:MAG: hypothetical protein A2751_01935 [Candidatus Doudnabacteria bacterium RIFCSPHIGHO2_01_FULL_46_14]|uniref:GtrA/DPMS transmembrane domain-containing protein n=1 Tax=Candidatus Doudnabacteria bacterium RIFCSPHIGHO2_01_FULL_46_14 TaxID=1817824 RepID=A0A1F5NJS5_9BACT|nr:MAG: hypothetical protein A2751_01935 [Candidatus Doudnabacteria bacterium RIFCSPHIGHO2_01_FULL_46_14]